MYCYLKQNQVLSIRKKEKRVVSEAPNYALTSAVYPSPSSPLWTIYFSPSIFLLFPLSCPPWMYAHLVHSMWGSSLNPVILSTIKCMTQTSHCVSRAQKESDSSTVPLAAWVFLSHISHTQLLRLILLGMKYCVADMVGMDPPLMSIILWDVTSPETDFSLASPDSGPQTCEERHVFIWENKQSVQDLYHEGLFAVTTWPCGPRALRPPRSWVRASSSRPPLYSKALQLLSSQSPASELASLHLTLSLGMA